MPRRQRRQGLCSQPEMASSSGSAPTGSSSAWKKLLVFGGLLVTLGINARLLNWQARVLESQDPQQHPPTMIVQREDPTIMGICPPDLRPMDPLNNPRDACLVNIRQRHEDLLRAHIDAADHILYLDPSYHANVGDTMLSMGVLKFLEASKKKITQCHYTQTTDYIKLHCDDAIRNLKHTKYKNVLAVWHAGGNWGDIYPHVMRPRIRSFGLLLEAGFKILAMPSSYHYSNPLVEKRQTNQIATKVHEGLDKSRNMTHASTSQERVVFTWREQYSYERALEQYPFATNLLVPDIAFQLGPYIMDEYPPQYDFLAFLRIDRESKVDRDSVQAIVDKQRVQQPGRLNFTVADWPARYDMFGSPDPLDLKTAIQLMGVGRVAIADRLHATILTLLVDRPIVYVDQMTRKINKTLGVAMATGGCPNSNIQEFGLYQAEDLEEAVHKVVQILNQQRQDTAVVKT